MASARGYVVALRSPGGSLTCWLVVRRNGVAGNPSPDRAAATVFCSEAVAVGWAAGYMVVGWAARIDEVW